MNQNNIAQQPDSVVMFIDMNSFFATCEQQVNYWLRGRPVVVCVYTGKQGCIISPSIEAKKRGVKMGLRLHEAMAICPELVPLETHPQRYREFHKKFIAVLQQFSEDVVPKSIDEAYINFSSYKRIYKDFTKVAKDIKKKITTDMGDWFKCSIGIAPNAFLAKLGTDLQKPDGLVVITPDNIDEVLSKLKLTDLPGIANGMAARLEKAGIKTPLQLRHSLPGTLKDACKSIVGLHWHYRLNFSEVDIMSHDYKSMQAMRQISKGQRQHIDTLNELLVSLCMTLEKRMVKQEVFCNEIFFNTSYENGDTWSDRIQTAHPVQDGMEILNYLKKRMFDWQSTRQAAPLINTQLTSMGVGVTRFTTGEMLQFRLFEDNVRKDKLRKVVYDIKDKYGSDIIMRAIELQDESVLKDVIGFGSIKDIDRV